MTGSRPQSRRSGRLHALFATVRGDLLTVVAAVAAFLGGGLATFVLTRTVAWPALKSALAAAEATVVAVTPWDVVLLQATVALAVGVVFALEAALYRARAVLLGGRWPRFPLPATARRLLVVLGVVAFPLGALAGYEQVFPAVVEFVGGGRWTVVEWGRVAGAIAVAAGIAAQGALVAAVLAYGRGGRPDAAPGTDAH